jgi:hypothetical protein
METVYVLTLVFLISQDPRLEAASQKQLPQLVTVRNSKPLGSCSRT